MNADRQLSWRSDTSQADIQLKNRRIRAVSTSYSTYDFEEESPGITRLRLTITIQLAYGYMVLFNRLIGGFRPWEQHCVEELEGLARTLELH